MWGSDKYFTENRAQGIEHGGEWSVLCFCFLRCYLFLWERAKKRAWKEWGTEGEVGSPLSLMWGPIPGPQDHDLNRSQALNHLSDPNTPEGCCFNVVVKWDDIHQRPDGSEGRDHGAVWGRAIQAEGNAYAKSLRWRCALDIQGTAVISGRSSVNLPVWGLARGSQPWGAMLGMQGLLNFILGEMENR